MIRAKECYCHTCDKYFHWLGITRHRAMHRDKKEDCKITFTHGDTYSYHYAEDEPAPWGQGDEEDLEITMIENVNRKVRAVYPPRKIKK